MKIYFKQNLLILPSIFSLYFRRQKGWAVFFASSMCATNLGAFSHVIKDKSMLWRISTSSGFSLETNPCRHLRLTWVRRGRTRRSYVRESMARPSNAFIQRCRAVKSGSKEVNRRTCSVFQRFTFADSQGDKQGGEEVRERGRAVKSSSGGLSANWPVREAHIGIPKVYLATINQLVAFANHNRLASWLRDIVQNSDTSRCFFL